MLESRNITIDELHFGLNENVKRQKCNIMDSTLSFDYHNENNINEKSHYFYLFECCMDTAFAHWVFESALYLPYFVKLKSKYPKLKLLVKKNPHRSYKKLFFNALNIHENDIFWIDNDDETLQHINYSNIPVNNICINTNPHYLNTIKVKDSIQFKKLIYNLRDIIIENLDICLVSEKTNKHLILPRSKSENFVYNNRSLDYSRIYKMLNGQKYIEYDTINTKDLKDQINLLNSSKNIYMDWGSSFLINSLFCKNSSILISGTMRGQLGLEAMKIIYDIHNENNSIHHI